MMRIFRRWMFLPGLLAMLVLSLSGVFAQSDMEMLEPDAGAWPTFMIDSVEAYRLEAPGDDAAEIEDVKALLVEVDDDMRAQVQYWTVGATGYRWNEFIKDQMFFGGVGVPVANRVLALLNSAIYDGTVAAWDSKYTFNRLRPSEFDSSVVPLIDVPHSPSYPSEDAVAAGAASEVLAYLFPARADFYVEQAEAAAEAFKHTGIYYPSDVDAGMQLGRSVAAEIIEWATNSVFDLGGPTEIDGGEGKWVATNPILPLMGTWTPIAIESADAFRPDPPYEYGSPELEVEMQELREIERTPAQTFQARYWEYGAGGPNAYRYWIDLFNQLVHEYGLEDNAPKAALANAAFGVVSYDSLVATFEAKYYYLGIRPFQYDPDFVALFPAPNHPSYPAAHSVGTMAVVSTMAEFFPAEADELMELGDLVGATRMWAGIHFRSDIEVGKEMGLAIKDAILAPFADIIADF
ncbi:MAG: phosphatase PAP2 family protein [Anaerolineaceae bacterium]|nr:phosphatase PAP2 family protein [Anaerolineaceae bacterium]